MLGLFSLGAQSNIITGIPVNTSDYDMLWDKFEHFELYKLPAKKINELVNSQTESKIIQLNLGNLRWDLDIHTHDIRSKSYSVYTEINGETVEIEKSPNITYRGGLDNIQGSDVRITITDMMILGMVTTPNSVYFIENLHHLVENAPSDIFIIYEEKSVNPEVGLTCGMDEMNNIQHQHNPNEIKKKTEIQNSEAVEIGAMACYEVIVSLACDNAFATKYGGGSGGKMIGYLNLVQSNYDNEFSHEISFVLGPMFIASGGNPGSWNFGSINSLLTTFRNWANGGGFGGSGYDVATLWFRKSFGGVIGLAWLRALCGGNRYNVCRDYTTNLEGIRVLQAHELGHNFGFPHDSRGAPFIMAPAVNGSKAWSSLSKSVFNSRVPYSCMGPCAGGAPPIADFRGVPDFGCKPMTVQFTDLSTNTPTEWDWTFIGGTPSSSKNQNPVVVYTTPGVYDVTLEATNSVGFTTERKRGYIEVGDVPIALFQTIVDKDEVIFIDKSIFYGIADYRWDFGDGNYSNDPNPTHIYDKDGDYIVTLTLTTLCGTSVHTLFVKIVTPPEGDFSAIPTEECVGTFVEFMDESSENVDTWRWKFDGGTPGTSSNQNPTVLFDTAGTFKVTLIVSNSRYNTKVEKVDFITIDSSSIADFTTEVDTLTVNFTEDGKYGREYAWDFGDGGKSNQQNPTRIYAKDSTYEVTLITSNFCDDDTISILVAVGSLPTASFGSDKQVDCLPGEIIFNDSSSNNTTRRLWKFEGGTPVSSSEENPTVTYDETGEYMVTLIAINGLGNDTLIEEKYITIEDIPVADFDFSPNGYDVEFMNTSSQGKSFAWDFGDGNTSTDENPINTYGADGEYEVILITSNSCGADTMSQIISISNRPSANFISNKNVGCVPMTIELENQSSGNSSSWEWLIPGGDPEVSTDENPEITFENPGLYRITLIAKNSFGNDTVVKKDFIEVLDLPVAKFNISLTGFTIDLEEDSDYGKEFSWDFGDGDTSDLADPVHVYTDEGEYEVKLTVKNICGEDVISKIIVVRPRPIIAIQIEKNEICKDNSIQYMDMSENDPTDWLWKFEGGDPATSTDQNPVVTYSSSGTYDVILEATNSFGTNVDTFKQIIRVFDEPLSAYDYKEQGVRINFVNQSEEYGDFVWDFGDGKQSTDFEPSHLYSLPGTYRVELTVTNECGVDSYIEDIQVRHQDVSFPQKSFPPTPNPTTGRIMVNHVGTPSSSLTILISDINGQVSELFKGDFLSGEFTEEFDLSNYQPGSYMMFFVTDNKVELSKIIIQD